MKLAPIETLAAEGALLSLPTVRECRLATKQARDRIRCDVCERHCLLPNLRAGFCKARIHVEGRLWTATYGDISVLSVNPIEKKPFFHLWPGSYWLTAGTWGCNLTCPWCQNYDINRVPVDPLRARHLSPGVFVTRALQERCRGTSLSFNEPTLFFEYALDLFPAAHVAGLSNNFVSNGYMTPEALRLLKEAGLDAIKFDLKGDWEVTRRYCAANVEIVWRNIRLAKELGLHVEVVALVIPGVNDEQACLSKIIERHLKEAGPDTPLHFTRFFPAYQMTDRPPTPVSTLEAACRLARSYGLHYVYVGNVPGHRLENTYCPSCSTLLIQREGVAVRRIRLEEDHRCPTCRQEIPIVGSCSVSPG